MLECYSLDSWILYLHPGILNFTHFQVSTRHTRREQIMQLLL